MRHSGREAGIQGPRKAKVRLPTLCVLAIHVEITRLRWGCQKILQCILWLEVGSCGQPDFTNILIILDNLIN